MKPRLDTVLAYVNRARKEMGLRALKQLPKGEIGHEKKCTLARALGVTVNGCWVECGPRKRQALKSAWANLKQVGFVGTTGDDSVELPAVLYQFVNHFDWSSYPTLVQK